MLLRTASAPLLNSWIPHSIDPSPDPEIFHHVPKSRSLTLSASSSTSISSSPHDDSMNKMTRAFSETDLRQLAVPKWKPFNKIMDRITLEEEEEKTDSFRSPLDLGSSLLNQEYDVDTKNNNGILGLLVGGGACNGGSGRNGGSDSRDNGNSGFGDSNRGKDSTENYYQNMIEANPGNSLLLSNYARFLKEVRGDNERAEEYCGRAILANPNDGKVLSMYADLIWQSHKDASRAEAYFDQAVKASPDDCFVLASYARFLWDAEEEDEEEGEGEEVSLTSAPIQFHGVRPMPPPIAAAS
ncbi:uncharacterized protein [Euphorbia lathyris]|uniref:uncharacterized protein n=1 Tax=Euphorbia lathyris TaxID=212925 RepID=UPI003313D175